jgi:hypothetical protein
MRRAASYDGYSHNPTQMANGDPESSVNDGSTVSLVGPTLNRHPMRSYYVIGIGNAYTESSHLG